MTVLFRVFRCEMSNVCVIKKNLVFSESCLQSTILFSIAFLRIVDYIPTIPRDIVHVLRSV